MFICKLFLHKMSVFSDMGTQSSSFKTDYSAFIFNIRYWLEGICHLYLMVIIWNEFLSDYHWSKVAYAKMILCGCVDFYFSNYQKIFEYDIGILLLFVSPKSTKNVFIDYWYHICLRPHWHYCKMWKQVCFVKISLDILCYYLSCIVYVGVHIAYRI